ncbi:ATP-binding protein [Mycoplasma putrefaciens]|uniref:Primosomal protein DnaI n=1 Tax=Mycoplasma putrefaciens Mput9231 TaxID=1292033 RepID=M9WHL7_9MOLU|nr:ATP-binding protein [Mycoplasma putrefaciens]AGJ90945.1 Primosomal protein DnaI [Mycoplasma putrefaciens Mput9231]
MQLVKYKQNPRIKQLIKESLSSVHPITNEILLKNQDILDDFLLSYKKCDLSSECQQVTKGHQIDITFQNNQFYLQNSFCVHQQQQDKVNKIINNYLYADFDVKDFLLIAKDYYFNELANTSFKLLTDSEKHERSNLLKDALESVKKNKTKGVYLYGSPGIGKTYVFKVLANTFSAKGKKVAFCTLRSVIDKVRRSFKSSGVKAAEITNNLKQVDVLFLDDIGGETLSPWSRDDFLFEILNYRMENKKVTFFTSNFSIDQLEENFKITKKNNAHNQEDHAIEQIKINRIISRIQALADEKKVDWDIKRNAC